MPSPRGTSVVLNTGALGEVWENVIQKRHVVLIPPRIHAQYLRDVSGTRSKYAGLRAQLEPIIDSLRLAGLVQERCPRAEALNPNPRYHKPLFQYAVGGRARFLVTEPRDWTGQRWRTFVAQFRASHGVSIVTPPDYIADP